MICTGIVLAGGRSSRFGSNKAIYDFQGKTMLKHSIDLLQPFCNKIIISGNKEEYYLYNYPCIPDKYGEIGPIGGIVSCLEESKSENNIVVTCDMPLITEDLIARLLMNHQNGKITIFEDAQNKLYPFPIILEKQHIDPIKTLISNRHFKLKDILDGIGYTAIQLSKNETPLLANINTPDDLLKVEINKK